MGICKIQLENVQRNIKKKKKPMHNRETWHRLLQIHNETGNDVLKHCYINTISEQWPLNQLSLPPT